MDLVIAICTYNQCRLLRRTLEALTRVQAPASVKWALLLIDNNSSDQTRAVADEFTTRLPLRYVFEGRQGLTQARRRALRETTAEWLAFLDDDCLVAPDWIDQAAVFAAARPKAGAIGGRVKLSWECPPSEFALRYQELLARQEFGDSPRRLPSTGLISLVGAGLVLRREALAATNWYEQAILSDRCGKQLTGGGDTEMILRIRNIGYEVWYNPAMVIDHIIPAARTSPEHICGLYGGAGLCFPALIAIAYPQPSPLLRYLQVCAFRYSDLAWLVYFLLSRIFTRRNPRLDHSVRLAYVRGWITALVEAVRLGGSSRDPASRPPREISTV
jgi:glycosyltransferase involved in cell wall biosynthesis